MCETCPLSHSIGFVFTQDQGKLILRQKVHNIRKARLGGKLYKKWPAFGVW